MKPAPCPRTRLTPRRVALPPQAHQLVEKMRARRIPIALFVEQEMLDAISRAVGAPLARDEAPAPMLQGEEDGGEIDDEDIDEGGDF